MKSRLLGTLLCCLVTSVQANEVEPRTFLFVSEPNDNAWRFLIENPHDRQALMQGAIAKLGGKMLSYYFGLGDGKNYIIVELPDDKELIQAVYVNRLGDDLLKSYSMVELLTSAEMAGALKRIQEVRAVDPQAQQTE